MAPSSPQGESLTLYCYGSDMEDNATPVEEGFYNQLSVARIVYDYLDRESSYVFLDSPASLRILGGITIDTLIDDDGLAFTAFEIIDAVKQSASTVAEPTIFSFISALKRTFFDHYDDDETTGFYLGRAANDVDAIFFYSQEDFQEMSNALYSLLPTTASGISFVVDYDDGGGVLAGDTADFTTLDTNINAMIENYRMRLSVLERLLEQLKRSNTIKQKHHDEIQA